MHVKLSPWRLTAKLLCRISDADDEAPFTELEQNRMSWREMKLSWMTAREATIYMQNYPRVINS